MYEVLDRFCEICNSPFRTTNPYEERCENCCKKYLTEYEDEND